MSRRAMANRKRVFTNHLDSISKSGGLTFPIIVFIV